ncbi:hypothetical protein QCA50_015476 [Cerrena zonata]|uniref:Secreted protein n=1 Tax=Cerrena zonata TaxID=2478898 RepID=A0AAW0FT20_9APHY
MSLYVCRRFVCLRPTAAITLCIRMHAGADAHTRAVSLNLPGGVGGGFLFSFLGIINTRLSTYLLTPTQKARLNRPKYSGHAHRPPGYVTTGVGDEPEVITRYQGP